MSEQARRGVLGAGARTAKLAVTRCDETVKGRALPQVVRVCAGQRSMRAVA
jgi:hypothetical protein